MFEKPERRIDRVFIHCSASKNPDHDDIKVIDRWHRDRGWRMVGYHYFIQSDGNIQDGRPVEVTPAAQYPHNTGTIAICLHGLHDFTDSQFASLRIFCKEILKALPHVTFHGHNEVSVKSCPNFDFRTVLELDEKGRMKA